MKIALIGYGKMGKTIEELAMAKGHEIVLKISSNNRSDMQPASLKKAEVAIEFSRPESAVANLLACIEAGVPVICGTTGWLDQIHQIEEKCRAEGGAFLYASNFSIGVNIFFAINQSLAKMMNSQPQYEVGMTEIHHTQKLDAPSGTAISLANDIIEKLQRKTAWINEESNNPEQLPILSERIDQVPGTHEIRYSSEVDSIEIKHIAHSRKGFAAGALLAAEWIITKKGCFRMKDVLGF